MPGTLTDADIAAHDAWPGAKPLSDADVAAFDSRPSPLARGASAAGGAIVDNAKGLAELVTGYSNAQKLQDAIQSKDPLATAHAVLDLINPAGPAARMGSGLMSTIVDAGKKALSGDFSGAGAKLTTMVLPHFEQAVDLGKQGNVAEAYGVLGGDILTAAALKGIEKGAPLATDTARAGLDLASNHPKPIQGVTTAVGALAGHAVPVVGPIVGGYLGKQAGTALSEWLAARKNAPPPGPAPIPVDPANITATAPLPSGAMPPPVGSAPPIGNGMPQPAQPPPVPPQGFTSVGPVPNAPIPASVAPAVTIAGQPLAQGPPPVPAQGFTSVGAVPNVPPPVSAYQPPISGALPQAAPVTGTIPVEAAPAVPQVPPIDTSQISIGGVPFKKLSPSLQADVLKTLQAKAAAPIPAAPTAANMASPVPDAVGPSLNGVPYSKLGPAGKEAAVMQANLPSSRSATTAPMAPAGASPVPAGAPVSAPVAAEPAPAAPPPAGVPLTPKDVAAMPAAKGADAIRSAAISDFEAKKLQIMDNIRLQTEEGAGEHYQGTGKHYADMAVTKDATIISALEKAGVSPDAWASLSEGDRAKVIAEIPTTTTKSGRFKAYQPGDPAGAASHDRLMQRWRLGAPAIEGGIVKSGPIQPPLRAIPESNQAPSLPNYIADPRKVMEMPKPQPRGDTGRFAEIRAPRSMANKINDPSK